jgi:hypothetical protein
MFLLIPSLCRATSPLFATIDILGYGWNKDEINVSLAGDAPLTRELLDNVTSALDDWNTALGKLKRAPRLKLAPGTRPDILIVLTEASPEPGEQTEVLGAAGLRPTMAYSCVLDSVTILLHLQTHGRRFTNTGVRNILRHEIGHALGLGHSNDPSDPMYAIADADMIFGTSDAGPLACHIKGLEYIYPLRPYCDMVKSVNCF